MSKKRTRLFVYSPVERKKRPKNSTKVGESKKLILYVKGNFSYYVFKKLKRKK